MDVLKIALSIVLIAASQLCSAWCESHPSVKQEFKDSRYVFVAQVEKSKDVFGPGSFNDGTFYTLRVTENLKGRLELRIDVFSENTTAAFPMTVGASYLVFVDREYAEATNAREWVINNCGNSGTTRTRQKVLAQVRRAADPEERFFRYAPKLRESQVTAIAARAAKKHRYVLTEYEMEDAHYDDRERRWFVSYWGKDRAIGNNFLVSISDPTGAVQPIVPGK